MRRLKHLPVELWPEADHEVFRIAYAPGDIFDETAGPGSHLAQGTRRWVQFGYRRWLGFLDANHPADLLMLPADRIARDRVRDFIDHLSTEVSPATVGNATHSLYSAARLIAPARDWTWLASIRTRLLARAKPQDRFDRLVPGYQTLDFGIELMDQALSQPITKGKARAIQYRDGLLLALLSLWPIRRRSIAALTVSRHIEFDEDGANLLLYPADAKSKRSESIRVPDPLVPYLKRYLKEIRPRFLGGREHDGFWASCKHGSLCPDRIYKIVSARTKSKFGKAMCLHDFRRSAATFLAMDAPEMIGLIPGVLQHAPDASERHYNLARATLASRRHSDALSRMRSKLRPLITRTMS
jgi:hypothetical protein